MLTDLLLRTDTFTELDDLFRRLDPRAGRGLDGLHGLTHASRRAWPQVHDAEADDRYVLTAAVPGLLADHLDVTFEDGVLTLKGRFEDVGDDEGWRTVRRERAHWSFERAFRFGRPVDAERVEASLVDGVLRVAVPLRTPSPIHIPVQAA
jgi:HSP20 family protein